MNSSSEVLFELLSELSSNMEIRFRFRNMLFRFLVVGVSALGSVDASSWVSSRSDPLWFMWVSDGGAWLSASSVSSLVSVWVQGLGSESCFFRSFSSWRIPADALVPMVALISIVTVGRYGGSVDSAK